MMISTRKLDQQSDRIRTRSIPWEGYERAGLISRDDVANVQRVRRDTPAKLFVAEPETYAALFVRLLGNLSRNDTLHFVLVLLSDLIHVDENVAQRMPHVLACDPYPALAKLADSHDEFIRLKSIALLATCVSYDPNVRPKPVAVVLDACSRLLDQSNSDNVNSNNPAKTTTSNAAGNNLSAPNASASSSVSSIASTSSSSSADDGPINLATLALGAVLASHSVRLKTWAYECDQNSNNVIRPLVDLLKAHMANLQIGSSAAPSGRSSPNPNPDPNNPSTSTPPATVIATITSSSSSLSAQIQYQIGVVVWLMSFEQDFCTEAGKRFALVHVLVDIAKYAVKEKVVRIVLSTFRNFIDQAPKENLVLMLQAQTLTFVNQLVVSKKWKDQEVNEDALFIEESLNDARKALTTWDEYVAELSCGQLSWSPVHESTEFWKENASKMNDSSANSSALSATTTTASSSSPTTLLKILVDILKTSTDPLALAICANDLAAYVRYNDPVGKKDVINLGVKERAMDLLSHHDGDVKWRALVLTQRLISQPWTSAS